MMSCAKRSLWTAPRHSRVVDHVRRRVALGRRVDVHAQAPARSAPRPTRGRSTTLTQARVPRGVMVSALLLAFARVAEICRTVLELLR